MSLTSVIGLCVGCSLLSFLLGAWAGIHAYRAQLGRANERGDVEIYVPPDTRVDNKTISDREPTAKLPKR